MVVTSLYRKKGERFTDNQGNALEGGKLYYYESGTTTPQVTYSAADGSANNTNPIVLDAAGRLTEAVYIGAVNDYKENLTDEFGATISPWPFDGIPKAVDNSANVVGFTKNLIVWNQVTSAQSPLTVLASDAGNGYEVDLSGGDVTINLPSATSTGSGKGFYFKVTATGASGHILTLNPDDTDTIDGGSTLSTSALNFAVQISSNGAVWDVATGYQAQSPSITPTGRLTLTTGVPFLAADVISATAVYYTACGKGNTIPIWNGSTFLFLTYSSDLVLTLAATAAANTIVDVFAFNNSGVAQIGWGPAWNTSTAGSGARGTGAGSTELIQTSGIWTNANDITLTNSTSSFDVDATKATYLGSLLIDGSAGQVTCHVGFGQSRKWGVWNAYNRSDITLKAGDSTASWAYNTATTRASRGDSTNTAAIFTGLPEERAQAQFVQKVDLSCAQFTSCAPIIGIGLNSTTVISGKLGQTSLTTPNITGIIVSSSGDLVASFTLQPTIGLNNLNCLENGNSSNSATFDGAETHMLLLARYRG